jgi:hypothetical protein
LQIFRQKEIQVYTDDDEKEAGEELTEALGEADDEDLQQE